MKLIKYFLILFLCIITITNSQTNSTKSKSSPKTPQAESLVPPPPPPPLTDGIFIHISSGAENPQKVLMGLSLAVKMAEDHDVYVFLDINAVNIVLNSAKSIEMPKFKASKILITKLLEMGVRIAVCPMCLEVANKTQYDLMKGITLAQKEEFFSFTRGRILTLDY